jgi:hypothetical protein
LGISAFDFRWRINLPAPYGRRHCTSVWLGWTFGRIG